MNPLLLEGIILIMRSWTELNVVLMMKYRLNQSRDWEWCRLKLVGITQTGNTPSKTLEYIGDEIPFITPGDIQNGTVFYDNQSLSMEGKMVARVCPKGSILQVCIGGSIGKAAIANKKKFALTNR